MASYPTGYAELNKDPQHDDAGPALVISVTKTSDANTVNVVQAANDKLKQLQAQGNGAFEIDVVSDSSTFIIESRDSLVREGGLGAIFAVITIFVFLLSLRSTLVAAVSIPVSIMTALALMLVAGVTVNIMTLGGLAIAVGRVVDDAIVVLENIYRHRGRGDPMREACISGTREVASAITSSTLTTVAVFLPLGFVGGIVSQFFLPFALTVTFALLASLLCALTVVPVMASLFIDRIKLAPDEGPQHHDTIVQRIYTPLAAGRAPQPPQPVGRARNRRRARRRCRATGASHPHAVPQRRISEAALCQRLPTLGHAVLGRPDSGKGGAVQAPRLSRGQAHRNHGSQRGGHRPDRARGSLYRRFLERGVRSDHPGQQHQSRCRAAEAVGRSGPNRPTRLADPGHAAQPHRGWKLDQCHRQRRELRRRCQRHDRRRRRAQEAG